MEKPVYDFGEDVTIFPEATTFLQSVLNYMVFEQPIMQLRVIGQLTDMDFIRCLQANVAFAQKNQALHIFNFDALHLTFNINDFLLLI